MITPRNMTFTIYLFVFIAAIDEGGSLTKDLISGRQATCSLQATEVTCQL
jgi:hypothetical protein